MKKISDAIRELIEESPSLRSGFYHDILNLTRVASHLRALIEARTKKSATESAILMSLSRLKQSGAIIQHDGAPTRLKNVTVRAGLSSVTFIRQPEVHIALDALYGAIIGSGGYMTINQGVHEITTILETKDISRLLEKSATTPVYRYDGLVALGVQFDAMYIDTPGFVHHLIELLTLQNINIIEFTSTYTELIFYIDARDVTLAFDTLYARCMIGK